MLHGLSLLLLAFALSVDGLGVGVVYGVRSIRIPMLSIGIIAICSGLVIFASMQVGSLFLTVMNPYAAKAIGAIILVGVGGWTLFQTFRKRQSDMGQESGRSADEWREMAVIDILRTPMKADMDQSGNISATEAALLGAALSLDAFGAGIGAALMGFSPLYTSVIIALSAGLFIVIGLKIGTMFAGWKWMHQLSFLPGIFLIVMGISKLF